MHPRALASLVVVAFLGCSGGDDKESSIARVEGFCAEWAVRACNEDVASRCAAPDAAACRESQAAFCEDLVPAGKYSPDDAKDCLDAVERAYADTELDGEERATVRALGAPCDLVLSGDAGPGEACTANSDCARDAGLTCVRRPGEDAGTCEEAEEAGGGQECVAASAVCAAGFYCDGTNCLAEKGEGSTCSATVPCAPEFNCELGDGTPPGPDDQDATCVARGDTGSECAEDTDCVSGICSSGASGGVCADAVILAPTEPICSDLR